MKNPARILATAAAVAALIALSGCGRADTEQAEPDEITSIDTDPASGVVTIWAMGGQAEYLPELAEAFEEENPEVEIQVTALPWDAAHNKFQTSISGGSTPDLAMMGSTWMVDFADAFATVPSNFGTDDFFEGPLAAMTVGDRLAGVPWTVDTRALYYREDLAQQAGWTEAPSTWDELKQLAKDLQANGSEYGISLSAGTDSFQSSLWMPWSAGAELADGEDWTLNSPEMQTGFEFYASFFAEGIADATPDTASAATEGAFVSGESPIMITGPWGMAEIDNLGGADYAVAPLPSDVSSTAFAGGSGLVVFRESENQDAAWKFAQWLSEAQTQADLFSLTGELPSTEGAWELPELSEPEVQVFGQQLQTAKSVPVSSSWVKISASGDLLLEKVRRGEISVTDALDELQAEADELGLE